MWLKLYENWKIFGEKWMRYTILKELRNLLFITGVLSCMDSLLCLFCLIDCVGRLTHYISVYCTVHTRAPITNRQKFVALSSLVEGLSLKVTGIKCPQTSDDSLFATRARFDFRLQSHVFFNSLTIGTRVSYVCKQITRLIWKVKSCYFFDQIKPWTCP